MTVGGEVFHILCKRVAGAAYPHELTGVRFTAPCDGAIGAAPDSDPRFAAMVDRRGEIVAALDQVFGDSATPAASTALFETGELDTFLANLIPFYDKPEEWTPRATRAIGAIMDELVSDGKIPADVRKTLARVAPRVGYRPLAQVLGAIRPALTYPGLDELTRQFMTLVTEGGRAHPTLVDVLKAGALELAEEKDPTAPPAPLSTLRAALDLLLIEDPAFNPAGDAPLWVVKRDERGRALPTSLAAPFVDDGTGVAVIGADGNFASSVANLKIASPFPRVASDTRLRDPAGRAMHGGTNEPLFQHVDANSTLLAAVMRDSYDLVVREGDRSTVEKTTRGLRPLLGPNKSRVEQFGAKASLSFEGPAVDESPLFDLVHAASALLRYEETDRLLEVLEILMREHETEAAATVYAGLRIDEISDEYPDARIVGVDGPGTPHEFWDDLIQIGTKILQRPGQLEAVLDSFATEEGEAATKLIAKFMKYKDQVTYKGAPKTLQADGHYSEADAAEMNELIVHTLKQEVDRLGSGMPGDIVDKGMNRSLWQRLISVVSATNGVPNCNKQGGLLNATLTFPLLRPAGYDECELTRQKSGSEMYMRAMAGGRAKVVLKDSAVVDLGGLLGGAGKIQEEESQIHGFTLDPTAAALTRFIYAPRVAFLTALFDPFGTKHGVPLAEYEPNLLFALEVEHADIVVKNKPQSFYTASLPLGLAFDDHELFAAADEDGVWAKDGYMFAELLSLLHNHWPSRRPADAKCAVPVKAGDEGCSQSADPKKPFFSQQSNLVSYEPLLVRALEDENLGGILYKASARLKSIKVGERTGMQVLNDFITRLITVDPNLAYRGGRKYAYTNTCEPVEAMDASGKVTATCGNSRGRVIDGVMPIYLLLDAVKGIDKTWENGNTERQAVWLEARSKLVDKFLAVTKDEADPLEPNYFLSNRKAQTLTLKALPWIRARIALYRDQGQDQLDAWADGLAPRLASVLNHPLLARGLDLLDILWEEEAAGAEFAKVTAYLMDEKSHPEAFRGLLVAATDTLLLVDRDPGLTPLFQFASLALAPNALKVIQEGGAPEVKDSATMITLELTKRITALYPGPAPTPLSRILKNAVLSNKAGEAPLEEIIDSSAEVNRADPTDVREKPLTAEDYKEVFTQVRDFLVDGDRGMERLYKVIQGRDLSRAQGGAN